MPRQRSPDRERALTVFLEHNGKIANREIANQLGIPERSISGWKVKDGWKSRLNGVLQTVVRSTPKRRSGAPEGNQNAKGNVGGDGGPLRNKKALKTGEHETIWFDALEDEERELLAHVQTDPQLQLDEEIQLFGLRERRMMHRIRNLMRGLTDKQKRVLQERKFVKEPVEVCDEKSGETRTVIHSKEALVITQVEETEMRVIDDIINLEEALTRIQDKKLKALDMKHRITSGKKTGSDSLDALTRAIRESDAT